MARIDTSRQPESERSIPRAWEQLVTYRPLGLLMLAFSIVVVLYYITFRVSLQWQLLSSLSLLTFAMWVARFRPDMRLF